MEDFATYYDELGVSEDGNPQEIRAARNAKIREFHPDHFADQPDWVKRQAHESTVRINEAFEVLSDPVKKKTYDALIRSHREESERAENDERLREEESDRRRVEEERLRREAEERLRTEASETLRREETVQADVTATAREPSERVTAVSPPSIRPYYSSSEPSLTPGMLGCGIAGGALFGFVALLVVVIVGAIINVNGTLDNASLEVQIVVSVVFFSFVGIVAIWGAIICAKAQRDN